MIKLRNFWVVLAMGCAFTMGTASCSDDEKEDEPTETTNADVITSEEAGNVMKEVVEKYTKDGNNLLDQATEMTKDQLQNLAETVIEYNKNKDNSEWMEKFLAAVSPSEQGKQDAKDMLNQTISQIVEIGVDMKEITKDDLLDAFSQIFEGKDSLGNGEEAGRKYGETHAATIGAVYSDKFASIPADEDHLNDMMSVFKTLSESQKKEFVNVALAWANKSDDSAWQEGFLDGTGLNEDDQKELAVKLDFLAKYKSFLTAMA